MVEKVNEDYDRAVLVSKKEIVEITGYSLSTLNALIADAKLAPTAQIAVKKVGRPTFLYDRTIMLAAVELYRTNSETRKKTSSAIKTIENALRNTKSVTSDTTVSFGETSDAILNDPPFEQPYTTVSEVAQG